MRAWDSLYLHFFRGYTYDLEGGLLLGSAHDAGKVETKTFNPKRLNFREVQGLGFRGPY